jgi:hypothetical protein
MSESQKVVTEPSMPAGSSGNLRSDARQPDREFEWMLPALVAGVAGALSVAVVFLAVDILSGRPALWTPAALGAALFLGESIAASGDIQPESMLPIIFGYTLMHGTVFISFGAMAASGRLTRERVRHFTWRVFSTTAVLLFLGLEVTFLGLGWAVGPDLDLAVHLGSGWIALSNAFAAVAMTATISRAADTLSEAEGAN